MTRTTVLMTDEIGAGLEPHVTPATAAWAMGCSPELVRQLLQRGELAGIKTSPRRWAIPVSAVRAWVARRSTGGGA
jgi:excisionase family DNA binding protein